MISRRTRARGAMTLCAGAVAMLALAGCQTDPAAAAVVGGSSISLDSVDHTVSAAMRNQQFAHSVGGHAAAVRVELARLITQRLIDHLANRMHVSVTTAQVNQERNVLNSELQSQQGVSLPVYYGAIGVPTDQVDSVVRSIALEQQIGARLTAPLPASRIAAAYHQQIAQFMRVHVAHILVSSKALADSILAQVRANPASFAALAKKYSTDTGSAKNGGDLGTQSPASFVAPFAKAVETAPVGSFVEVHSQYGWHVVHVISRQVQSLAQATPAIEASLQSSQRQAKLQAALTAEAKRAHVSVNPRFGSWDAAHLQVLPPANKVSKPVPSASP